MNNKEFFEDLSKQWSQEAQPELPVMKVEDALRTRRRQQVVQVFHVLLDVVGVLAALYFLTLPLSPVTLGAAVVLLCSVVLDFLYTFKHRRVIVQWNDWSPEGLISYRQRLVQSELRNATFCLLSSLGLLVFTGLLWLYAWREPGFAASGFHKLFSACSVPVATVCIAYFGSALRRKRKHYRRLTDLLSDYSAAG